MGKNQHVTPHKEGGWQVKGENNTRATVRTDTQAKAIQRARESKHQTGREKVKDTHKCKLWLWGLPFSA